MLYAAMENVASYVYFIYAAMLCYVYVYAAMEKFKKNVRSRHEAHSVTDG